MRAPAHEREINPTGRVFSLGWKRRSHEAPMTADALLLWLLVVLLVGALVTAAWWWA